MKKLFIAVSIIGLGFLPFMAIASNVEVGQEYTLRSTEVVPGNFYTAGGKVVIAGSVSDDLVLGAGDALVRGSVGGDALIGGGTVAVLGSVSGDVRAAGGTVTIGGSVSGDVLVAGGEIHIISGASVGGDVIAAGGRVVIDGPVGGSLRVAGGEVIINEKVTGDVRIRGDSIVVGNGAIIGGMFQYASPNKANINANAQIQGEIRYTELPRIEKEFFQKGFRTLSVLWALFKFLTITLAGYVIFLLFHTSVLAYVEESLDKQRLTHNLFYGVVGLVGFPVFITVCFLTIVGALVGAVGALGFIGFLIVLRVIAPIAMGVFIYRRILHKPDHVKAWHVVLVGNSIFSLIKLVPVAGHLIDGFLVLCLAGVLTHRFLETYLGWRKRVHA